MPENAPFKPVLDALLDDEHAFPARYLHHFSDLEPTDLKTLLLIWQKISTRRKHALLEDLEDLAETDTLTNLDDLARALLSDEDPFIRMQSIRLLWECEDARLIPIYRDMLKNDPDVEARAAAASALGPFVYRGELDKIPTSVHQETEDDLLVAATSAKETLIRRRALESLGFSGREQVLPLIESAYHEKNPDWVVSALCAMGRSSDEHWTTQVLSNLLNNNPDIRLEAIQAAGELEIGAARSILLDLLEDEEDLTVRRTTAWALSKIGGEGVRARLETLIEIEEDEEEAEFFEEALDNLSIIENLSQPDMFGFDPDRDFLEVDPDEENKEDIE